MLLIKNDISACWACTVVDEARPADATAASSNDPILVMFDFLPIQVNASG